MSKEYINGEYVDKQDDDVAIPINKEERIIELKSQLRDLDYMTIVNTEQINLGNPPRYLWADIEGLKQPLRDEINRLEELIEPETV